MTEIVRVSIPPIPVIGSEALFALAANRYDQALMAKISLHSRGPDFPQ
jgi:hypothetical protein